MDPAMADNSDVTDAVAGLLAQPKRARTDAGEVEMQDIDKAVKAAEFVMRSRAASSSISPFACLRVAQVSLPGGTGGPD